MDFRIAIGQCGCKKPYKDSIHRQACERLAAQLVVWQARLPADLGAIPVESSEVVEFEGHTATVGTSSHELEDSTTLVVFQAFVHAWSRPTYLSVGAVGRMCAEGFVVTRTGTIQTAPDELMWEYR